MAFTLKSPTEILALISGQDFAALALPLKQQIAGKVVGAADALTLVVPVLLANAGSPLEAAFVKALVLSDAPVSAAVADPAATLPWTPSVTSVGDGAPNSLERLVTADRPLPDLRLVYVPANDQVQTWLLYASTAANHAGADGLPDTIRPLDYSPANARVWFRK